MMVDDLDLDARSQWIGKGRKSVLNYLNKPAISIQLAITAGHVLSDLDFENLKTFIWLDHLVALINAANYSN